MTFIFKEIAPHSPFLSNIKALYESAFPPDERRDFAQVEQLLAQNPYFKIRVIFEMNSSAFAAFLSYWNFGSFAYIEHLAVMPDMRGNGLGHKIMNDFFASVGNRVLLEVEPPIDTITRKRVAFYESLGMTLWDDFHYIQPPYAPHLNALELRLMTHGTFTRDDLTAAVATLHREVYGVTQ